jgi:hypothetical protein
MNHKTLSVFDLDDTLLITPTFSALIPKDKNNIVDTKGEFSEFFEKIKSFFLIIFSKEIYFVSSGDFIVVFDGKTKAPLSSEYLSYVQDVDKSKMSSYGLKASYVNDVLRALEVHDGHLVFKSIPDFHKNPKTVGGIVNDEVFKAYKNAQNKMILTGRNVELKSFIESRLEELGLELPNFGVYCFPGGSTSIQNFKIQTILDSIQANNWSEINFYEDRKDWLESAKIAVAEKHPNVVFHPHLITLTKHMRSL